MIIIIFLLLSFSIHLSLAPQEWSLENAERAALENNWRIRSLQEYVEAAKHNRTGAMSQWLPRIKAFLDIDKVDRDIFILSKPTGIPVSQSQFYRSGVDFNQLLFSKKVIELINLSQLNLEASQLEVFRLINDTIFETRKAYFQIILAKKAVELQNQYHKLIEESLNEELEKFSKGESTSLKIKQARTRMSQATLQKKDAQLFLRNSNMNFARLIGESPDQDKEIETTHLEIPLKNEREIISLFFPEPHEHEFDREQVPLALEKETEKWEKIAQRYHIEILKQSKNIEIAQQQVEAVKAGFYPEMEGKASYRVLFPGTSAFTNQRYDWLFVLNIKWDLFDFELLTQLKEEKSRLRGEIYELQQRINDTKYEINLTINEIHKSIYKHFLNLDAHQEQELQYNEAKEKYKQGLIKDLEFQNFYYSFLSNKFELSNSAYELLIHYYSLRKSAGVDLFCDQ